MALLIVGTALSGCCVSGIGCSTPTASGGPTATSGGQIAWDGLGEAPTANDEPSEEKRPKRKAARNRDTTAGSPSVASARSEAKSQYEDWTRLPNEDREADAKIARQIKICRDC